MDDRSFILALLATVNSLYYVGAEDPQIVGAKARLWLKIMQPYDRSDIERAFEDFVASEASRPPRPADIVTRIEAMPGRYRRPREIPMGGDRSPHEDWIVGQVQRLLVHFFMPGDAESKALLLDGWILALRGYASAAIVDAIDWWIANRSKRPTPADIADVMRDRQRILNPTPRITFQESQNEWRSAKPEDAEERRRVAEEVTRHFAHRWKRDCAGTDEDVGTPSHGGERDEAEVGQ